MGQLSELGKNYGTDKAGIHTFNGKNFLDVYESFFYKIKDSKINFLELGILNGSSLGVWQDYFQYANIIGLDIDPNKKQYENDRVKIYIASQDSLEVSKQLKQDYPDGFDVILDDASHINELTFKSFELLFDQVKSGGLYIIEDTHCTYGDEKFAEVAKGWPGMSYNSTDVNYNNNREDFNYFLQSKIKELDCKRGDIYAIHIYSETIVIEKV